MVKGLYSEAILFGFKSRFLHYLAVSTQANYSVSLCPTFSAHETLIWLLE